MRTRAGRMRVMAASTAACRLVVDPTSMVEALATICDTTRQLAATTKPGILEQPLMAIPLCKISRLRSKRGPWRMRCSQVECLRVRTSNIESPHRVVQRRLVNKPSFHEPNEPLFARTDLDVGS